MKIAQIQFAPWDKVYNFDVRDVDLVKGSKVVVETELGLELGEVISLLDINLENKEGGCQCPNKKDKCGCPKENILSRELKPVLRVANEDDLEKMVSEKEKNQALEYCKGVISKLELPMKLIDAHFSFDGSKVTFAFIADTRVDFRELVKDLTRHFSKAVRLQQIGIRDEAKMMGDFGPCGRRLCCAGFLNELTSITSEMAELQQCAHRGSERISGVCGRLMCCLSYEQKGYEELTSKMPPLGAKVSVDGKKGTVIGHNALKHSVKVEFAGEKGGDGRIIAEVDLNRNKK